MSERKARAAPDELPATAATKRRIAPFGRVPTVGAWWAASVAVAAITTSRWLETPSVQYLVVWVLATVAAAVLALRLRGASRAWALACAFLLTIGVAIGIRSQSELAGVTGNWPDWQARHARAALDALRDELNATEQALTRTAAAALDAPADREAAFAHFRRLLGRPDEQGVVLYRGDSAFAWAGRLRVAPDTLVQTTGISASEFYLTMYATARRGQDRAVATVLLSAAPPADRLSSPLSRRVARRAGLDDFVFTGPGTSSGSGPVLTFVVNGRPLLDARAAPLESGQVIQQLHEALRIQVGLCLALALACFIIGAWRETRAMPARMITLGVVLACVALVPLNEFSNLTRLFDPTVYFTALGGALTANAGALGLTSAIVLLGLLTLLRRGRRPSRWTAAVIVLLVAGLGPFLLRDLARGIRPPTYGVSAPLWLIWEIPLFLAAAAVLLAGAGAGSAFLGRSRGLPPYTGAVFAGIAAVLAPIVWEAPGQWPWWYTFLWIGAIAALALGRQTRGLVVNTAIVAALGASTLVWGRTARGRVELAEHDLGTLSDPDPQGSARSLLDRFGAALETDPPPPTRAGLLQHYVVSALAAADYPTALYAWDGGDVPVATLATARFAVPMDAVRRGIEAAVRSGKPLITTLPVNPAAVLLLAVPTAATDDGDRATAVVVAPRTRLIAPDPFANLLGLGQEPGGEPPYTLQLTPVSAVRPSAPNEHPRWERRENALHADWMVPTGAGVARAHIEVALRDPVALIERGTLIVLLDLAIVGLLWILSVVADGGFMRWLRARQRTWARSYRLRLSIALFAFFVIPALAFAAWSYQQLSGEAVSARDVLVRETLRAVAPPYGDTTWLSGESARLDTPLFEYIQGELHGASDPLLQSLAPVGRFLRNDVERLLVLGDEESVSRQIDIGTRTTLFGFRSIDQPGLGDVVIASPARSDALASESGRADLSVFVLFATALGALAALWLSGIAARQLARPIGSLREAALSLASGDREPALEGEPTVEFRPVFAAFRRMAADLNASRSALEEAQRRTAAILRNVASGVVAVDANGRVLLANPRADVLLDAPLPPGTVLARVAPRQLTASVERFIANRGEDEAFELEMRGGQQELRVRLTPITEGVVITLDDITELARAQRVLAWGEMARQVAHEIKNPLTPIRLGVQHLRRARADKRVDFDRVLDQNVNRILAEIDRLDEIARAFSRYGSAPNERPRPEPIDVAAVVRDVVGLESMAGSGEAQDAPSWELTGADEPVRALALGQELREVLLNVFENARLAGARRVDVTLSSDGVRPARDAQDEEGTHYVSIVVRDDGRGISPDVLPRIFEPHFSTRTSGSGLGLAISRQMIDGWGGAIAVESEPGRGTTVRIDLRAADYSV